MNKYWYRNAYRRNVIDMHITADRKEFLSAFDADEYVGMLKKTEAKSAVVYAHSHVGYCLYPTRIGRMHPNLHGKDIFGEVCSRCQKEKIAVVGYMSIIHDTYAYDSHPEWRIMTYNGQPQTGKGRYGLVCPNQPGYRAYSAAIAKEIVTGYPVNGIRFDMTFWPGVCYCDACRRRFREECGKELPTVVNWLDPDWVSFQRCRERWISEYAGFLTDAVRSVNPDVSVEHQSSVYAQTWGNGVSYDLAQHSDFLQGDFYGGYVEGSTACKLFYNLSPSLPFGFETCSNENLYDHTTLKPECMLKAKSYMAIANGGAFVFIDAIDPVGTLNPFVYDTMGRVFRETSRYEGIVTGKLCQNAAIYLSSSSRCSFEENGMHVSEPQKPSPHLEGFFKTSRACIKNHIPYGVITGKNLSDLSRYSVIILSDVLMMSEEEVCAFREYVRGGGTLFASAWTSLTDDAGHRKDDFMLSDVFGVHYQGETEESVTYFAPTENGKTLFPSQYHKNWPIFYHDSQILTECGEDTEILAEMVLPYTNPRTARPFASIHSNPPGNPNGHPSVVRHRFGKGVCIYSAPQFEREEAFDEMTASVIQSLIAERGPVQIKTNAPRQAELLTYRDQDGYTIAALSFQAELPNLPIPSFEIRLFTDGKKVVRVQQLPDLTELPFTEDADGYTTVQVPSFDNFTALRVKTEKEYYDL